MLKKRALLILAMALLSVALATVGVLAGSRNWSTRLTGEFELPVAVDTKAHGQAKFKLSQDGEVLSYKLKVANIQNVFMAHIHAGPATSNGPVVVWLYPSTPNPAAPQPPASWLPGRTSGKLAEGEIRAANLVGPLAGQTLADLVALMNSGGAYVNVHTSDFEGANNTGPGDMSSGEIRGNLSAHEDHENGEDEDEDDDDDGGAGRR
jgi:hypothetical protein